MSGPAIPVRDGAERRRGGDEPLRRGADEVLLGFTRALRAAGVAVTQDRSHGFLAAVALLGLDDQRATYLAGRATLCAGPDDLERYDQVFEAWFNARDGLPRPRPAQPGAPTFSDLPASDLEGGAGEADEEVIRAMASDTEVLRHRDVAEMSPGERARLAGMFATIRPRPPMRRTARHQPWHRGDVDASRTLRASLRRLGEPAEIAWRRRGVRPRRVVLLVDVSGSMSGYADPLLRLAHRFTQAARERGGVVETFTVGTRLTHLTRALRTAGLDVVAEPAGPFVLARHDRADALRERLRHHGFALRRGDTFPGLGPQWLRVAAREEATTDALSHALSTALQELP